MKITMEKDEMIEISYNGVVYVLMGNPEGKPQLKFSHVEKEKLDNKK